MNLKAIFQNPIGILNKSLDVAKEVMKQSNDSRRWKLARWVFELYILNLLIFVLLFSSLDSQSFMSIASTYITVVIGGWTAVAGVIAGFYYKTYDKVSSDVQVSSINTKTETAKLP